MGCLIWLSHFLCLLFFHLLLQAACSLPLSSNLSSPSYLCALDQSLALLQFKNSFMINTFPPPFGCEYDRYSLSFEEEYVPYPKTESWKEGTDCCSWDGVTCDLEKGHVIGLDLAHSMLQGTLHPNSSLFFLRHLEKLDLSCNDFNGSHVSPHFGQLASLKHLYLTNTNLDGRLPSEISHLSRLVSLDMSQNTLMAFVLSMEERTFRKLAQNLTRLRELNFNGVSMSFSAPDSLMNLSSLTSVKFSDCGLQGRFPGKILGQPNLQLLDLFGNLDLTGTLPSSNMSTPLWYLDLSWTNFSVNLDIEFVNNHKSLKALRLSHSNFVKSNLEFLSNFTTLIELHLSSNELVGQLPSSFGKLKQLSCLSLQGNSFSGQIPYEYDNLTKLVSLDLSFNNLFGQLPLSFGRLKQLRYLSLSDNNFSGQIPREYGNLTKLTWLELSSNKLVGQLPSFFERLKQLQHLYLENNDFFGQIPREYGNITELSELILSSNQLTGPIHLQVSSLPNLRHLFLSNNSFSGVIPLSLFANSSSLESVDLSQNMLYGPIPRSIFENVYLGLLTLSHNKLTKEVPSSICKLKSLGILDLSNNDLSGFIPPCLGNFSDSLLVLDLNSNKFQGAIPANYSEGNNLEYLDFNDNRLSGKLPESLINCRNLEVLDLGINDIEDNFPEFLGTLPNLQVLVLRSNKLQGHLKCLSSNFSYSKLRIFDLSNNFFSGNLPTELFNNLQAMMTSEDYLIYMNSSRYVFDYSVEVTLKGVVFELVKIQNLLTVLDLSNNKFIGTIPETIGRLKSLKELNLSHNHLTGHILSSFGNLTNLESIDISSNFLTGRIPMELVDLTSLEVLNLSNNQLEGPIPTGKQFNTFGTSSFEGNIGLCGFPLPRTCNDKRKQDPRSSEESGFIDMDAFYLTFAVAFIGVLLTLAAVLWINPYWRQAWFYFIEVCITTCFYFLLDNIPILSKFRYFILRF